MKKRLLLFPLLLLFAPILLYVIYIIVILIDVAINARGADTPMDIGSFNVIETSTIDPTTILSSLDRGDQNVFNFELGLPPDDPLFVTSIEWRQVDYVNLATSIFHTAWDESVNDWKLYRMGYWTECDHPNGFTSGEFYFYFGTSNYKQYSTRGISMEPEYGYVVWGGDTYYHRPLFGWKSINMKEVTVTAEEALRRADASGGMEARQSWEGCRVSVIMWPEAFRRYIWRVDYWDNNIYNKNRLVEFWIPAK
jgi:hypothetical protein